jgi:hypothetical protein
MKDTPLKDMDVDLHGIEMTPRRKSKVKRKLMLGNAFLSEIRKYRTEVSTKARRPLHSILAGNVTKKYRLISALRKGTGCARNSLLKCNKKVTSSLKEVRKSLTKEIEQDAISFLRREGNCRIQPGKADAKKEIHGTKTQTVILTDYMKNLHLKFLSESPSLRLSFSSFCRVRPKSILLACFITRNACPLHTAPEYGVKGECITQTWNQSQQES